MQDQVKRSNEKDIEKYFRTYETSLSSKTCDAMIDTFHQLSWTLISHFLPVDQSRSLKDLNENFKVKKELSMIAGRWLIVLCEMVLCETKRNEMKSVLCEMKICTLRNEICTLRNENLYFAK